MGRRSVHKCAGWRSESGRRFRHGTGSGFRYGNGLPERLRHGGRRRRILRRSALLRAKPQQHHGRSAGRSLQELRSQLKRSRAGRRNRHLTARRNGKPRLQRIRSRNRHGRDYARHNQRNEGRRDQDRRNLRGRNGRTGQLPRSHRHSHRSGSRHKWNGRRRTSRRSIFHFYRRLHQGPEPDPQRRHGQYRWVRGRTPRSFWIR